MKTFSSA